LSSRTGALLWVTAGERRGVRSPKRRACPVRGMPRPRRIETPRSRSCRFSGAHVARESGWERRVRGRRAREAGLNVEVRKPQGAESHERRGRRPSAFTGGSDAGAGLDSGVKAWKPELLGRRPMSGFGRSHPEVERQAGAGPSRGEPTRNEQKASEGRIPRVPAW
jgi:hypothetical protein